MSETQIPRDLKYAPTHEWIRLEGDILTIGITDHAQHELGDIVFVELPEVGTQVEPGKTFASIEAVKTVADLFSPASGEVVEINEELGSDAGALNRVPYESWVAKIRVSGPLSADLMDADAYKAIL